MAWDADTRDAAQPQLILDVQRAPVEGFSVPAGPGLVFVVRAVTVAHPITRAS